MIPSYAKVLLGVYAKRMRDVIRLVGLHFVYDVAHLLSVDSEQRLCILRDHFDTSLSSDE